MNYIKYSSQIESVGDATVFQLISDVGTCVGKIIYKEEKGRMGIIYKISLLGTANGGEGLEDIGLTGIDVSSEQRVRGLFFMLCLSCLLSIYRPLIKSDSLLTLRSHYLLLR